MTQTDKEKIAEALRLLDKILRAKKEEYGFSYPELNSGLVHGHFIKIKEIYELQAWCKQENLFLKVL
mgnify:CR=1 FL=1